MQSKDKILPTYLTSRYSAATPKEGFVAFLDILGYRSVADDSEVAGIVFGVMEEVTKAPGQTAAMSNPKNSDSLVAFSDEENKQFKKNEDLIHERIQFALISDSFICTADMTGLSYAEKVVVTTKFFESISRIYSNMFLAGLPLRGVSYGEFYSNATRDYPARAFLGEAVMSAHKLEGKINAAVIALENLADLDGASERSRKTYAELEFDKYYRKDAACLLIDPDYVDVCGAKVAIKITSQHPKVDNLVETKDETRKCINITRVQDACWSHDMKTLVNYAFDLLLSQSSDSNHSQKRQNTIKMLESRATLPKTTANVPKAE